MDFEEQSQYFSGLTYGELQTIASEGMGKVLKFLSGEYDQHEAVGVLLGIIFLTSTLDGTLTVREAKLISEVTGLSDVERVKELSLSFYKQRQEWRVVAEQLAPKMPKEVKKALFNLCLSILVVDGKISSVEQGFIKSLI